MRDRGGYDGTEGDARRRLGFAAAAAALASAIALAAAGVEGQGGSPLAANRNPEWQLPAGAHVYYSTTNADSGATPDPVVTFGPAETYGKMLAKNSTFHVVAVQNIEDLRAVLGSVPCIGLVAMSLDREPGGAGQAIEVFRASPSGHEFALYAA